MQQHKFNCEEIQQQSGGSFLSQKRQQIMEQPNHRLVVQSEPRLRTNQQDLNSQFDRISQTEPRKDDKENTLILAAENNQLYGFDIYRDSNLGISECFQKLLCVDRGFDFDVETTWSELSNIKREWAHEVNERMNWSNSETTMSEPSISNKPSKGFKDDDILE